jgi:hypothetical protein
MYHPSGPSPAERASGFDDDDYFEFIEIRNVGSGHLLLDGLRFTKGIDVSLTGALAPGAAALLVANRAAFEMRYGTSLPILAEWQAGDRLDNGGEQVRLRDDAGQIVREFTYDDSPPWPAPPDGSGASLVLIAPASLPDHALASNWRASSTVHGNPGSSDATTFPGGDAAALLSYAVRETLPIILLPDGRLVYAIEINLLADDLDTALDISEDLQSWQSADDLFPRTSLGSLHNGFALATFTSTAPLPAPRLFLRARISLR